MDLLRLKAALHPLGAAPAPVCWNAADLEDVLALPLRDAAVLVGLVPRESGDHVLLTRRIDGLREHGGQVSFPGGRVDPGDADVVAAALRETHEEVGIEPWMVRPLGLLDPLATITGYRVVPVVAHIDPAYRPRPDPREVAEVFEVPLGFLLDEANVGSHDFEHAGRARRVLEYRHPHYRIWGATASMLSNLRHRLEAIQ